MNSDRDGFRELLKEKFGFNVDAKNILRKSFHGLSLTIEVLPKGTIGVLFYSHVHLDNIQNINGPWLARRLNNLFDKNAGISVTSSKRKQPGNGKKALDEGLIAKVVFSKSLGNSHDNIEDIVEQLKQFFTDFNATNIITLIKSRTDYNNKHRDFVEGYAQRREKSCSGLSKEELEQEIIIGDWVTQSDSSLDVPTKESRKYWWLNANPKRWRFEDINEKEEGPDWDIKNKEIKPKDLILGYKSVDQIIVCICEVTNVIPRKNLRFRKLLDLKAPVPRNDWINDSSLEKTRRGTLFKLSPEQWDGFMKLIENKNPGVHAQIVDSLKDAKKTDLQTPSPEPKDADGHQLPRNLIYFGAPGTGKSHKLKENVERSENHFIDKDEDGRVRYERVTFYPTYSYAQFVGCYKPVMKAKSDGTSGEEIAYKFVPGPFLRILEKALNNPKNNYCLVIEEINRANAAAVFGDVFQLLDRKDNGESEYEIAVSEDTKKFLEDKGIKKDSLRIPFNMYIWATMNSADQGVFPLDTAFKRRWEFEYVGINDGDGEDKEEKDSNGKPAPKEWTIDGKGCNWNYTRKLINRLLLLRGVNEDKLMGPFFVKPDKGDSVVSENQFKSKVLMYIWEDAARMCRRQIFGNDIKTYPELTEKWETGGVDLFKQDPNLGAAGDSEAKQLYDNVVNVAKDGTQSGATTGAIDASTLHESPTPKSGVAE